MLFDLDPENFVIYWAWGNSNILQHILLKSMPATISLQESCRNRKRIGNKVHGSLYGEKINISLKTQDTEDSTFLKLAY